MSDTSSKAAEESDDTSLAVVPDAPVVDETEDEPEPPDDEQSPVKAVPMPVEAPVKRKRWAALRYKLYGTKKRVATTIMVKLLVLAAIIWFTPLRYPLVGAFVKAQIDVRVRDAASGQLLPAAVVTIGNASATTDKAGIAHLSHVHPGKADIDVAKPAYKAEDSAVTIGFGDQGTTDVGLNSTGIRISFKLTNYVTGQPVSGARVQLAGADAVSDTSGQVTASVAPDQEGSQTATIATDGYNDASMSVKVAIGVAPIATRLVPSGTVYYLSNRSGHIDLYGANLDGSNANVVLPGTGYEDQSTGILPNVYDPTTLALVSSRAGKHIDSSDLEEDLYIFRPNSSQLTLIDSNINFSSYRTWLGKTLIYQKTVYNNNVTTTTIHAYDPSSGKNTTIVTCTEDGACPQALYSTDDAFFYTLYGAPSGSTAKGLFAVKTGTTTPTQISDQPQTSAYRQSKSAVIVNYYQPNLPYPGIAWSSLDLTTDKLTALANGPSTQDSRTFVDSPGDKYSASVDKRDGQTDLYLTNEDGSNERQLTTSGDVTQFVQWYGDNYVVYSAANTLYVVGVAGGKPQKITNFYSGAVNTYAGGYNPQY